MENVNHDFKYHCEIQYETQDCFGMTSAVGNDMKELLKDIKERFNYYKDRNPKIITAIYDPNKKNINITSKVLSIIKIQPNRL